MERVLTVLLALAPVALGIALIFFAVDLLHRRKGSARNGTAGTVVAVVFLVLAVAIGGCYGILHMSGVL